MDPLRPDDVPRRTSTTLSDPELTVNVVLFEAVGSAMRTDFMVGSCFANGIQLNMMAGAWVCWWGNVIYVHREYEVLTA